MSNALTRAARPLALQSNDKAVLMALCDMARDPDAGEAARQCWPPMHGRDGAVGLCDWTCLSERAVQRSVKALKAAGLIDRRQLSHGALYTVLIAASPVPQSPDCQSGDHQSGDCQTLSPVPQSPKAQLSTIERKKASPSPSTGARDFPQIGGQPPMGDERSERVSPEPVPRDRAIERNTSEAEYSSKPGSFTAQPQIPPLEVIPPTVASPQSEVIDHPAPRRRTTAARASVKLDAQGSALSADPLPPLPPGASEGQWGDYDEMRRGMARGSKPKPWTPTVARKAREKLTALATAGHDPGAVLDQSVLNGWQGLYPPKGDDDGRRTDRMGSGGGPRNRNARPVDGFTQALREASGDWRPYHDGGG